MSGVEGLYSVDKDALVVSVHVQPRAGRSAVVGRHGAALKVRIAAPPVDDRANVATAELLATSLDVPVSGVTLVSGAKSRLKRFKVVGAEPADLIERLERVVTVAEEPAGPHARRRAR